MRRIGAAVEQEAPRSRAAFDSGPYHTHALLFLSINRSTDGCRGIRRRMFAASVDPAEEPLRRLLSAMPSMEMARQLPKATRIDTEIPLRRQRH